MRRREFIARLGAAGAYGLVPRLARAQQGTRVRRVALLAAGAEGTTDAVAGFAMFRNELAKLGWVEGRNLQIDLRFADDDPDRMRANAAEVLGLAPDVVVANSPPVVMIVQQQTQTIPIGVSFGGDVFAFGLVKDLAHPEGNTTGVINMFASVAGKWVELLKEAVPRIERVGYVSARQLRLPRGSYLEEFERHRGFSPYGRRQCLSATLWSSSAASMPSWPSQTVDWL
jgi:putative tryptophan/tyrosine transport system substrate-binding protein